jgi:tRNA A37 methylthiotransferase MiaB
MFFDDYDSPVFRPPSEAYSFILRLTRGCAHNKCTYCNMYRGVPFQVLTDKEIASQIAQAAAYNRDGVRAYILGGWRCHGFGSTALTTHP